MRTISCDSLDAVGDLSEFSLPVRLFLRAYPWRRIDPLPWTPLGKPLAECRVALVSSAGLVPAGDQPFDDTVRGGDWSWRPIPEDVDLTAMVDSHRSESFDHTGLAADRNLVFPRDRLRELAAARRIAAVAPRHASFMGSISAPGRLVSRTAPAIAEMLLADQVDVGLLVPV